MIFELLKLNIDVLDEKFDSIYPDRIKMLTKSHWTPVAVAKLASEFLAEKPGTRVLDIGSGVGKFCMVGASYTRGYFVGVEQRADLVQISNTLARTYEIPNVKYIHSNITSVQFTDYDAFYFYNPFHENVVAHGNIGDKIDGALSLYDLYAFYVYEQFSSLPAGTRVVTYHSSMQTMPNGFNLIHAMKNKYLQFWEKVE